MVSEDGIIADLDSITATLGEVRDRLQGMLKGLRGDKPLPPNKAFVAQCWKIFDDVGATRPPASLLAKWKRELFNGNPDPMIAALDDLAPRGYLSRGESYVYAALKKTGERIFSPEPDADNWPGPGTKLSSGKVIGLDGVPVSPEEYEQQIADAVG